jgi:tetratricopeptide (TPR) repeat protein
LSLASARATTPAATSPASAPAPARPSPEFTHAIALGNAKYAARDFPAAIDAYQKAADLRPHDGTGFYLLGEAQLAAGRPADAEAAWTRASAESAGDPALHARVLFVLADVAERQKKWDDAKARWTAYRAWAAQYPAARAFPATADARIQAIDRMLAQDKAYEPVRQRIAETQDGGVFNDVGKPAPAAK